MTTESELQSTIIRRRQRLISELQTHGLRLIEPGVGSPSRRGGAGPSDHKAVTVMGTTIMVPIHTRGAGESPFAEKPINGGPEALLYRDDKEIGRLNLPPLPRFYGLETNDGIPYWKIAQLHARDVLATTVLQTCIRYGDSERQCRFCAIGESLRAELGPEGVGVSVLCPGPVESGLAENSDALRPTRYGVQGEVDFSRVDRESLENLASLYMSAADAARIALKGIQAGAFLIPTHAFEKDDVDARYAEALAGFALLD